MRPPQERRGEAEGAGLSPSPAHSASRAPPSHILGRPGPGEPSGFLVVPGRAEGVAEGEAEAAGLSAASAPREQRGEAEGAGLCCLRAERSSITRRAGRATPSARPGATRKPEGSPGPGLPRMCEGGPWSLDVLLTHSRGAD